MAYQPYTAQAQQQIQGAQAGGAFDLNGSPQLRAALHAQALRNSSNAQRRNALLSQLMGLDPNQARVAAVNSEAAQSGATSQGLLNAGLQQQLSGQQYARGLFMNQLGNEQQLANAKALAKYQQQLQRPTFGGILGGIAGQGLGGLFGGLHFGSGGGGGGLPSLNYLTDAAGINGPSNYDYLLNQMRPYQPYQPEQYASNH